MRGQLKNSISIRPRRERPIELTTNYTNRLMPTKPGVDIFSKNCDQRPDFLNDDAKKLIVEKSGEEVKQEWWFKKITKFQDILKEVLKAETLGLSEDKEAAARSTTTTTILRVGPNVGSTRSTAVQ